MFFCALLLIGNCGQAADSLADLAEQQKTAIVEQRLSAGEDVNVRQADGMTALHWAVHHDNPGLTRRLLQAGADADAANDYGVRPLHIACTGGNAVLVELLLQAGADPNSRSGGGETALMTAARTGRPEPVQLLIRGGADVNATDAKMQSAAMWAAADGHASVVQLLIDAGANVSSPLSSGFTPMFFAAREGRTDVVRVLLKAGSDPNAVMETRNRGGRAPRNGTSPLIMAVENGHFELAAELLRAGADPNDQRSGFTALHVLTWVRKPNRGDGEDGDPAPIGSGTMTSLQFAEELVRHGADVNARLVKGAGGRGKLNQTGATPFLLAADTADLPYMKLLLKLGADPSLTNADHATPLMAAAGLGTIAPGEEAGTEEECLAAVHFLLDLGADLNAIDDNGETTMHGAAYKSAPDVIRFLHARGADIRIWNQYNRFGWTPLLIARGYRPGNFRPAAASIDALCDVMLAAGVTPDLNDLPAQPAEEQYAPRKTAR